MILEEIVKTKLIARTIKRYHDLGYSGNIGDEININVNDLPIGSHVKITAICDVCGGKIQKTYQTYVNSIENFGYYTCQSCSHEKNEKTNMQKYGVKNPFELDSIKRKVIETNLERYGVENPSTLPEVKEKVKNTNLKRYGVTAPMQNNEIFNKAKATNLLKYGSEYIMQTKQGQNSLVKNNREKYGVDFWFQKDEFKVSLRQSNIKKYGVEYYQQTEAYLSKYKETCLAKYGVESPMQTEEVKTKVSKTLYKNGSCKTSKQQLYINDLYGGILNFPIKFYNLDTYIESDRIDIEYDGSGHNMCIYKGNMTEKQFIKKEIARNLYIKSQGMKQIHIISKTDKLPSDDVLLDILNISKEYFATTNHSWIEWYLDENKMRNAENKGSIFYDFGQLKIVS